MSSHSSQMLRGDAHSSTETDFLRLAKEELQRSVKEKESLDERIDLLDIRIRHLEGLLEHDTKETDSRSTSSITRNRPAMPRKHRRVTRRMSCGPNGEPVADADAVVELLKETHEPMHYRAIHKTLTERGFYIGGKGEANTLLSRFFNDQRLLRIKQGTYVLKEGSSA